MRGNDVATSRERIIEVCEELRDDDNIPKEAVFAGLTQARNLLKKSDWDEYSRL